MTLKNLLGIRLDAVTPDKALVAKLLAAAQRNIADAQLRGLGAENRFSAAYKAVMQLAMVALHANGFRTLTSKPGHHPTAIQTLPTSVGLPPAQAIVLDALRKQRKLADDSGDLIPDSAALECLASAMDLLAVQSRAGLAQGSPAGFDLTDWGGCAAWLRFTATAHASIASISSGNSSYSPGCMR